MSRYIRLSFSYPLSPRLLLLRGFAALLPVRLLCSGFMSFTCFPLRLFHLPSPDGVPLLVCALTFSCFSLNFGYISLSFLFFYMLQSRFRCFISCIVPPTSVGLIYCRLRFLFLFPRLCAVLSRSLPVRSTSLSFFHSGFLMSFPDLAHYFLVRSLCHRLLSFFSYVFLSRTFKSLQSVCPASFLVTVQPVSVYLGVHRWL